MPKMQFLPICLECAHEWSVDRDAEEASNVKVDQDFTGTVPIDGDTIAAIRHLKVKGTFFLVKVETKVKHRPVRW